jgi:hypothetical protein
MINYLKENKKIHKLKKFYINTNKANFAKNHLIFLIYLRLKYLSFGIIYFLWEFFFHINQIRLLLRLKSAYKNNTALVLANGPSQDLISKKELMQFINLGGKLFFVNYWFLNEKIKNIIPNFLVISDIKIIKSKNKFFKENNSRLKKYILKYQNMKIICTMRMAKEIKKIINPNRIICFCDSELNGFTSNIKPIYPRGYLSSTVYKAIAMAVWFSFKKIYILGVDNTYPKNIYVDINNQMYNHEVHAGIDYKNSSLVNISDKYSSISDFFYETAILFDDAKKLNINKNIINLDKYSLTDAFPKINFYKGLLKNLVK